MGRYSHGEHVRFSFDEARLFIKLQQEHPEALKLLMERANQMGLDGHRLVDFEVIVERGADLPILVETLCEAHV